jgi:hypothetical protein
MATEEIKGCAFWLRHIAQEVKLPHELVKDDDKERCAPTAVYN